MSWTEDDSAHFIDEGKYFVPEREAQIATICAAIPPLAGAGHIVELCSGEGLLTRALLERFAEATLHAVVSSLAVHHLDGAGKQALFKDVFPLLAPGGVFVLADVVEPAREGARSSRPRPGTRRSRRGRFSSTATSRPSSGSRPRTGTSTATRSRTRSTSPRLC